MPLFKAGRKNSKLNFSYLIVEGVYYCICGFENLNIYRIIFVKISVIIPSSQSNTTLSFQVPPIETKALVLEI